MMKFAGFLMLLCAIIALADSRVQARRGQNFNNDLVPRNHPYLFLSVPRGHSGGVVQGYEIIQEDDPENDDDDDASDGVTHIVGSIVNDEDDEEPKKPMQRRVVAAMNDSDDRNVAVDDDDDDQMADNDGQQMNAREPINMQLMVKNAKPTNMMVSREHAGSIMVPDGIIEIEGQTIVDEETGKTSLLVPRAALEAIPDGSVVALMERSPVEDVSEEERANRVIVRRRRKGSRRNVNRRNNNSRRRRPGNNVRNGNNRVQVVYRGGNNRLRGVRRGSRPMVIQGYRQ